jgi:hypothetical protein
MRTTLGEPAEAVILTPPGPPEGLGAEVRVPVTGEVVRPWQAAVLTRVDRTDRSVVPRPPQGDWREPTVPVAVVTLASPEAEGDYVVRWSGGGYEAWVPLFVRPAA